MLGLLHYRGCARRAYAGHFGRLGSDFGHGGGLGGRGFFGGRKLGAGELQLLILALLEERPQHQGQGDVKQQVQVHQQHARHEGQQRQASAACG